MFGSLLAFWVSRDKSKPQGQIAQTDESRVLSFDKVKSGGVVKVLQISAGRTATRQLAQLGVRPGATLKVHRRAPLGGPILVESAGSKVAIGRGLARRVSVTVLK